MTVNIETQRRGRGFLSAVAEFRAEPCVHRTESSDESRHRLQRGIWRNRAENRYDLIMKLIVLNQSASYSARSVWTPKGFRLQKEDDLGKLCSASSCWIELLVARNRRHGGASLPHDPIWHSTSQCARWGFEPTTFSWQSRCSTTKLSGLIDVFRKLGFLSMGELENYWSMWLIDLNNRFDWSIWPIDLTDRLIKVWLIDLTDVWLIDFD